MRCDVHIDDQFQCPIEVYIHHACMIPLVIQGRNENGGLLPSTPKVLVSQQYDTLTSHMVTSRSTRVKEGPLFDERQQT